jgi:hypothetical protein
MARLPEIQPRGAVTRGPQSSLSAAEIANPFQQIANGLDAWSETLQRKDVADAQDAGSNAVYRDPDGTLRVDSRSNLSATGRAYNNAAQQGYAARLAGDIRTKGVELTNAAKGNIDTFNSGWKAFRDQTLTAVPKEFRGAVTTMLDSEGPRFSLGVSEQKRTSDLKEFEGNIKSQIQLLDDDASALARGGGVGTGAYKEKQAQIKTLYQTLADNPDFTVGQQEADIALQRMEGRHMSEAMVGQVESALNSPGGLQQARSLAQSILTDDKLALTPAERRQYSNLAEERINGFVAQTKANLKPIQDQSTLIQKRIKEGVGLDNDDIDQVAHQLAVGGDLAGATELTNARALARTLKAFSLAPNDQQTAIAAKLFQDAESGSVDPELIKEYRQEVTSDAKTLFGAIRSGADKGTTIAASDLDLLSRQLAIVDDPQLRADVSSFLNKQAAIDSAKSLAPPELESLISSLEGDTVDGATVAQQQIISGLKDLQVQTNQALQDDALGFAIRRGMIANPPALDLGNPNSWGQTFGALQAGVDVLQDRGFVGNIAAMRPGLRSDLETFFSSSTPADAVQMLSSMATSMRPETYKATLGQLYSAGEAKGAAIAGTLVPHNAEVATAILRGKQILAANPSFAPKKSDDNEQMLEELLPVRALPVNSGRSFILDAANARYADLSYQTGDTSGEFNEERMQQSINEVTGGLVEMNGSPTVAPVYGMDQQTFDRRIASLGDLDLSSAMTASGEPVRASDLRREGRLRAVADGLYMLEFGPQENPSYVLRRPSPGSYSRPTAYVLDLR